MIKNLYSAGEVGELNATVISQGMLLPSVQWGVIATVKIFVVLVVVLAVAPWAVLISPLTLIILAPLLGAYIYKLTIVMHDCCHNTLFPNPKANKIVGMVCGAFLGTNYRTFTQHHWEHHKSYGCLDDPQKTDYLNLQTKSRIQIVVHLLRPLFGFNLFFKLFQLNSACDKGLARKQLRSPKGSPHSISSNTLLSLGLIAFTHAIIGLVVTGIGRIWWLVLFYPVCASTFSLFFSQIRGFCEHVPSPNAENERHVRTHMPNVIDRIFFYDLNFNFHLEHHTYPQVPSCHLPNVCLEMLQNGTHSDESLSSSIIKTIYNRIVEAPT